MSDLCAPPYSSPAFARAAAPQPAHSTRLAPSRPAAAWLQDSKHCNAGRGSNLSFQGLVECDASVMDGDGTFGAVAAAPGARRSGRGCSRASTCPLLSESSPRCPPLCNQQAFFIQSTPPPWWRERAASRCLTAASAPCERPHASCCGSMRRSAGTRPDPCAQFSSPLPPPHPAECLPATAHGSGRWPAACQRPPLRQRL